MYSCRRPFFPAVHRKVWGFHLSRFRGRRVGRAFACREVLAIGALVVTCGLPSLANRSASLERFCAQGQSTVCGSWGFWVKDSKVTSFCELKRSLPCRGVTLDEVGRVGKSSELFLMSGRQD